MYFDLGKKNAILGDTGKQYIVDKNEVLGHGSYATVYKGVQVDNRQLVAVKIMGDLKKGMKQRPEQKYISLAERELSILKKLQPNNWVIGFIDSGKLRNRTCIITEYCEGGPIRNKLKKSRLPVDTALDYLFDIALGLCSLHRNDIIHRDLNLQNILLHNGRCKIADFGSGIQQKKAKDFVGTPSYQAPEIQKVQKEELKDYNNQIDVWSMGVIGFKMFYGRAMYKEYKEKIEEDRLGLRRFPQSPNIPKDVVFLLDQMLRVDPDKRMTARQVVEYLQEKKGVGKDKNEKETILSSKDEGKVESEEEEQKEELPRNQQKHNRTTENYKVDKGPMKNNLKSSNNKNKKKKKKSHDQGKKTDENENPKLSPQKMNMKYINVWVMIATALVLLGIIFKVLIL